MSKIYCLSAPTTHATNRRYFYLREGKELTKVLEGIYNKTLDFVLEQTFEIPKDELFDIIPYLYQPERDTLLGIKEHDVAGLIFKDNKKHVTNLLTPMYGKHLATYLLQMPKFVSNWNKVHTLQRCIGMRVVNSSDLNIKDKLLYFNKEVLINCSPTSKEGFVRNFKFYSSYYDVIVLRNKNFFSEFMFCNTQGHWQKSRNSNNTGKYITISNPAALKLTSVYRKILHLKLSDTVFRLNYIAEIDVNNPLPILKLLPQPSQVILDTEPFYRESCLSITIDDKGLDYLKLDKDSTTKHPSYILEPEDIEEFNKYIYQIV